MNFSLHIVSILVNRFYILCWVIVLYSSISVAQNRVELEKRRTQTLQEISETENLLDRIKQTKTESLERLNLLDRKIMLRNKLIENLTEDLTEVENKIVELEKMTFSLSNDVTNIKTEYAKMIYLAYLNRGKLNGLIYILASKDFDQAYKRVLYLKQYSEYRKKQVHIIAGVQNTLKTQISELELTKTEKVKLVSSKENENSKLKQEMEHKGVVIKKLKQQESELNKKLKEKLRIAEKLKSEIENAIHAEIKARANSKKEVAERMINNDVVLSNTFRENKGKLPWPTDNGVVSSSFGEHPNPIYKGVKLTNLGIDISTKADTDVKSVFEGEVIMVNSITGANYFVLVKHGNFFTIYQNLVDVKVKRGDKVKTKQHLGKVYTDVISKSAVLQFQIWEEKNKLDPEMWLKRI